MKHVILFVSCLLIFLSNPSFAAVTTICEGPYVLCAYAQCVPGKKGKANCTCEVKSGYSIGNKACQTQPVTNKDGKESLDSRYFPVKRYVTCHNNRTWANCYNSPCVIDPKNKDRAFCSCSIVSNKSDYMYATDSCDTSGCKAGMISSYVVKDAVRDFASLKTVTNYDKLPGYTPEQCPAKN
jgi:hypothetical protein